MDFHAQINDFAPVQQRVLKPGFFLLQETAIRGAVPRKDKELMAHYKLMDSLQRKAYYVMLKHAAATPFALFVDAAGREALEAELAEIKDTAEALNAESLAYGWGFVSVIRTMYVSSDPDDPTLRQAIIQLVIERLANLRQKLATLHPVKDRSAFNYAVDLTRNLSVPLTGIYAEAVTKAVDAGKEIAHELRVDPSLQPKADFSSIDEAKALLEGITEARQ